MSPAAQAPLLRLHELVAGYAAPVVGPVSLAVGRGDVVGLLGANGRGKSTLLAAIGHAASVFAGHIERAPGLRLRHQGQAPPPAPLPPLTGREMLRVAGVLRPPPAPLAGVLRQRLDRLSGGQVQALRVWAALAAEADLVLLDEPTNNLDPTHLGLLTEALRADAGTRGVLLVSHERAFLDTVCTRVLALE